MSNENQETEFDIDTVETLLETAKSEYDNEHSRTTVIDTKIGISLPIVAAYFIALAQMNNYKEIFAFSILSFWDVIIPSLLFLSYTFSLVLSLISILMMVHVIIMRDYYTIKPRVLYDNDYLVTKRCFFLLSFCHYILKLLKIIKYKMTAEYQFIEKAGYCP